MLLVLLLLTQGSQEHKNGKYAHKVRVISALVILFLWIQKPTLRLEIHIDVLFGNTWLTIWLKQRTNGDNDQFHHEKRWVYYTGCFNMAMSLFGHLPCQFNITEKIVYWNKLNRFKVVNFDQDKSKHAWIYTNYFQSLHKNHKDPENSEACFFFKKVWAITDQSRKILGQDTRHLKISIMPTTCWFLVINDSLKSLFLNDFAAITAVRCHSQ